MSDNISPRQPAIMGVVCIYLLVVRILYILQYIVCIDGVRLWLLHCL